jgi:hypothetical protein
MASPAGNQPEQPEVRWLRRLRWFLIIVGAVAVLVVGLWITNYLWSRSRIPGDFASGLQGTFRSDVVCLVSGRLYVRNDFRDMSCGQTREFDVAIYYDLWSLYRPGQVVYTRLAVTVGGDRIEGSNFGIPATFHEDTILSRARNPGEPLIEVVALSVAPIVGAYCAAEPSDRGHFVVERP